MAIRTNTTKTIERASSVLAGRCEATQQNMDRLLAQAGCREEKKEQVMLPLVPGSRDDVVFVGLNGVSFYFMRGMSYDMAAPLAEILRNTGHV